MNTKNDGLGTILGVHRHQKKKTTRPALELYLKFMGLFIVATCISITGQYAHLKYPNMSIIKVILLALPFAWVDWYLMTWAVSIQEAHHLWTPTQDTMLLIMCQFSVLLVLNHFYLKQKVTRSDLVALPIILVAIYISGTRLISRKLLHIPHPKRG